MPDRLEQRLAELAAEVEFPPTPDLAPAVAARVDEAPARPRRLVTHAARSSLALVALAVLAAVAGAVPGRTPRAPRPVRPRRRDRGTRAATARLARRPRTGPARDTRRRPARARPSACACPTTANWARPTRPTFAAVRRWCRPRCVYRPRRGLPTVEAGGAGLLLTEFRGDLEPDLVRKFIGPDTGTRRVRVGSATGFWVEGPHSFGYRDANGVVRIDQRRLASGTLLWRRGPVLLRLESELPLRRALEVARSVR